MTTFTRDVQAVNVKASVGSSTPDFEVSTDGTVKIFGSFVVSGSQTFTGNAIVGGSLGVTGATSLTGQVVAKGGFTVSAISSLDGAVVAGSTLSVGAGFTALAGARVSAIASLEGAVVAKSTLDTTGTATFSASVAVGNKLQPTVTIGVSSFNPLIVTRYMEISGIGGVKVFLPIVSVLP